MFPFYAIKMERCFIDELLIHYATPFNRSTSILDIYIKKNHIECITMMAKYKID